MEQMRSIWAALDEMMEKDPAKYQDFIKSQMEMGREVMTGGCSDSANANHEAATTLSSLSKLFSSGTALPKNTLGKPFQESSDACQKKASNSENKANIDSNVKDAETFNLKLPAGVTPTNIDTKKKGPGVLIEEISSTEDA